MSKQFSHETVLLHEAVASLNIKADGFYVDATFGRGGHSAEILKQLGSEGKLLVIDKDPTAIAFAKDVYGEDERVIIVKGSFKSLGSILEQKKIKLVDGVLLDLGVSSPQLDDAARGFSFMRDGDLDMRMDNENGVSAKDWINSAEQEEIANVIYQYGEERLSRRIARKIVMERQESAIETTLQLADIVSSAVPKSNKKKGKHPATRTFQAIRIFVNQELSDLTDFLGNIEANLADKARLVIISFHSLEDRVVKQFIRSKSKAPAMPRGLPIMHDDFTPSLRSMGKPIKASAEEVDVNVRSRSAIMRIAERCA